VSDESTLLLDACCAIILLASGRAEQILASLPHEPAVVPLVLEREVFYVDPEPDEGAAAEPEPGVIPSREEVRLKPLVERGVIRVLAPETEQEHALYVDLALELDDGEAMTGALAIHRNASLATDDRKAIRVLGAELPPERILRTSHLVKTWADAGAPIELVRQALRHIENRASFLPPQDDPLLAWWKGVVGEG
jgi:hypothetical protein